MSDTDRVEDVAAPAGARLRAAREARGLSLAAVAERTRVPLRHLEAIEAGDYESLPSSTYATGFARAYARAVGADEVAVARDARAEAMRLGRRQPDYEPYVAADPARLPSRGLVIVTAGIALAVLVLVALWLGSGRMRGDGAPSPVAAAPSPAPAPAARPSAAAPAAARQVTLTANDTIWVRVYDRANKTLFLGVMKPGEKFDVPPGADHPLINVGRADKLAVTLDGKPVAPLGDGARPIKDVPVDAASLAARATAATPAATPAPRASSSAPAGDRPRRRPRPAGGDETERANRSSARAAERGQAPPVPSAPTSPSASPSTGGL